MSDIAAQDAADVLKRHPDYRVLTRFRPEFNQLVFAPDRPDATDHLFYGLYVDCETTGLDADTCTVIELAAALFVYNAQGRVLGIVDTMDELNDPGERLTAEIVKVTGLTDADLKGQRIDGERFESLVDKAGVVIAHRADFDRRVLERHADSVQRKYWACSYQEVPWRETFGTRDGKLITILETLSRQFYDAHRALDDCLVGVHCLGLADPDGKTALMHLLESARRQTVRMWAEDTEFKKNATRKVRGWWWSEKRKMWFLDAKTDTYKEELAWIKKAEPRATVRYQKITALDRYSVRVEG